jgi:hypothetical protein
MAVFLKLWSTVVCQVVCGGFGRKGITKIILDTERMKNTAIHVCVLKLPLLVELQHKVGESVLSITSCPSIIIL